VVEPSVDLLTPIVTEPVREIPLEPTTTPTPLPAIDLASILAEPVRTPTPQPTHPRRTPPTPTGPPQPPPPVLLAPHPCQHCGHGLTTPINRKAATPECPACHRLTSVYAIQFRCQKCGVLLEAPKSQGGTPCPCPTCQAAIIVPKLELLEKQPWPNDPDFFACECPGCHQRLIASRKEVGQSGVCPYCRVVITVPNYGTALPSTREPIVARQGSAPRTGRTVPCEHCGARLPPMALTCPMCGEPNPHRREYPTG
jgi:hypothetical protein